MKLIDFFSFSESIVIPAISLLESFLYGIIASAFYFEIVWNWVVNAISLLISFSFSLYNWNFQINSTNEQTLDFDQYYNWFCVSTLYFPFVCVVLGKWMAKKMAFPLIPLLYLQYLWLMRKQGLDKARCLSIRRQYYLVTAM